MLNMTIYERIKELRKKRGMTQQELAEKVGYKTGSAVNKVELGLRDLNYSKICAFAVALETTASYLCDGEKEKKNAEAEAVKKFVERLKNEAVTRLHYGAYLELEETECVEIDEIDNLLKEYEVTQ